MPSAFIIAPETRSHPVAQLLTEAFEVVCQPSASFAQFTSCTVVRSPEELYDLKARLSQSSDHLICALTLDLPEWIAFAQRDLYTACANLEQLRQQVSDWHEHVGAGTHWLPIVLTAKGPLYAEAITQAAPAKAYHQPLHLTDRQRQPLYQLGQRLLKTLHAPPAVYLMQFGYEDDRVWFDRLLPFPDAPAIASQAVQTPNLFICHWRCLTHQPVRELSILSLE